jgi:hypothetical protein
MSQDEGGADLLLQAIGEFRQELIQWIDSQLGLLREREARLTASPPETVSAILVPATRPEPRAQSVPASRAKIAPQGASPAVTAEMSPSADARHRLDTLARQLGERLRLSGGSRRGPERTDRDGPAEDQRPPTH